MQWNFLDSRMAFRAISNICLIYDKLYNRTSDIAESQVMQQNTVCPTFEKSYISSFEKRKLMQEACTIP